jgi:hypothetical protein
MALVALALPSCGKKPKPLFPTQGKLIINGQPAANVLVFFHPVDTTDPEPTRSFATSGLDGTFKVTTRAQDDGMPEGEYIVTLLYEPVDSPLSRPKGKPPTFDKKYNDAKTSPLRAKITNQPMNTLEPFDVK